MNIRDFKIIKTTVCAKNENFSTSRFVATVILDMNLYITTKPISN